VLGTQTRYRTSGLFHKLATTPLTQTEWLLSQAVFQLFVVTISITSCILVGVLAFGVQVSLAPVSILIMIVSTFLFAAVGLIIARFAKDEESAGTAAGAVTFPMMFLSGSFIPLDQMPGFLQTLARFLPLTYVNEGLRESMIYGVPGAAWGDLAVLAALAAVFMAVAIKLTDWKER